MEKKLADLFQTYQPLSPIPDVTIKGIQVDSRLVQPGDVFVAVVEGVDRYRFLEQVVARGAAAVVGVRSGIDYDIPYVQVAEDRTALAHMSAALYDFPSRHLTMIGVTGTDGKTTTSNFIYQILQATGLQSGMVTTVNALIGDKTLDTGLHVTTPEAYDTQRYLRQMVDAGLSHAVLESTSHGLAQQRGARPEEFDIAVVTNITHEHLDYHGSYEAYFQAKARLFSGLAAPKQKENPVEPLAVLNLDDRSYQPLSELVTARQISYGMGEGAVLTASEIENSPDVLRFTAHGPGFSQQIETGLIGEHNVWNTLAALGATVVGLGIEPEAAAEGIRRLDGVPGRMERISLGQDFLAVVDFAHTPFALEAALKAGRKLTDGRVIAIFGSAGLRDKQKRRMMAEISAQLADVSVLTAEDPRTESLAGILQEMAEGAKRKGGVEGVSFFRVPDRGEAIRFALSKALPGDLVMALGKGHEQSMCFGETEYPWDDRTALRAALAELLGEEGPAMPHLPTQEGDVG